MNRLDTLKEDLLREYASHDPALFYEWSGWAYHGSERGWQYCLTHELMDSYPREVRVLIQADTADEDAIQILKEIVREVEEHGLEPCHEEVAERLANLKSREVCPCCKRDIRPLDDIPL